MAREVESGSQIILYAEFYELDTEGNRVLTDPDTTPLVSIYDAFHDPRSSSIDLINDSRVYRTSATQVTTGIYSYAYTVPSSQITAYWFDRWEATIGGTSGEAVMQFLVVGADVGSTPLQNNFVIQIILDSTVSDTDGNTLGEDYEFWFTTEFDPMYSDPVLLRLYAGNWLSQVPDETLMLMLYESSKLADDITPPGCSQTTYYKNARSRFVTYDAALRLLSLPINQGGKTKSLGDLFVKNEGASFIDLLDRLLKERDEWFRVVNACGEIAPGESLPPITTVKGRFDPDRRPIGRRWDSPGRNDIPGANDKHILFGRRLYTSFFNKNSSAIKIDIS
jgi:hypothetical protein